jgi:hypothetical protein
LMMTNSTLPEAFPSPWIWSSRPSLVMSEALLDK